MLEAHNIARSLHEDTGPLTWDNTLQRHAEEYAMKLARTNDFEHDSNELKRYGEGENLYYSKGQGDVDASCDAPMAW